MKKLLTIILLIVALFVGTYAVIRFINYRSGETKMLPY